MAKAGLRERVMYDGVYTFVMRLLNVACAAGLGILTARLLGPAGKGTYALPSVEAGLIVSGFSGLSGATSYFLLNRTVSRSTVKVALVTAVVFCAAGALALLPIAWFSGHAWSLIPAIVSLPASAAINLAAGYAIGIKRVRYATTINVAVTVVTLLFMAGGLFLAGRTAGVAIVAWIAASTLVAAVAVGAIVFHARRLPAEAVVSPREFLRFALKVGVGSLVSLLNYRADLYIVALMTTPAALGTYTVAVSAAESLLVPTQVAALVTSPHIGSFDVPSAANLAARCVRNNLLVALAVCGVLFVAAHAIVPLLYGDAFVPAVAALQILLIGVVAMSLGSPMASFFTLKLGKPEVPLVLAGLSAAICITLSLVLVRTMGITGAALASSAAYICGQTAATWYFCKTTGFTVGKLMIPTTDDLATYVAFLKHAVADGRAKLRGLAGGAAR